MNQKILKIFHALLSLATMMFSVLMGAESGYKVYQSDWDLIYRIIVILLLIFVIYFVPIFMSVFYEYLLSYVGLKIKFSNPFKEFNKRAEKIIIRLQN